MAQTQIFVQEVEIIMQAFAVIRNQICLAGLLVRPWLVGRAGLHRRENADQPGILAAFLQKFSDSLFLAEVPLADELDLDSRFSSHLLRVLANPVAVWLGELWIVQYPDLPFVQKRRHPTAETDLRQCPEKQHPVPTTQHSGNLSGVTFR